MEGSKVASIFTCLDCFAIISKTVDVGLSGLFCRQSTSQYLYFLIRKSFFFSFFHVGSFVDQRKWCGIGGGGGGGKMTNTATPSIADGSLTVGGRVVCTKVPENLVVSPESSGSAFLGATSPAPSSRHVFTISVLE